MSKIKKSPLCEKTLADAKLSQGTVNFTKDQSTVIALRGNDLLVSASAGTGKTRTMVERIASMISRGECEFKDLLVLTFTNASAADMKVKLRRRLEEISVKTENLNEATIGTFHKFCGEVIRTYFNIAGVSPDFGILDEVPATFLKQEVLGEVITNNYGRCAAAIETFCVNRKTDAFEKMLIWINQFLASRGDSSLWLDTTAVAAYETDIAIKCILDHYRKAGEYFFTKFNRFEQSKFCDECKIMARQLAEIKNYNDLRMLAVTANFARLSKCDDEDFKGTREQFKDLIKKLEPYKIPEEVMQKNGKRDREIIKQVIHIVREFETAYAQAKTSINKLDFNDLEKYTCVCLETEEVAKALRNKYKFIFIDEYQDTNPMQEKILASVAGVKNVFMVGDVKQSIYGFRGCEAAIFAGKMTDFDKNLSGKVVCLNENFRSRTNVLKFANLVFGKIMKPATADIDYNSTSKFAGGKDGGAVDVTLVNATRGTAVQLQAAIVAQKIAEMVKQGVAMKDIAILARSRTHFGMLAEALEKAGISVNVSAEQNACELFEIVLLNTMLFAVSNFYNNVPLVLLMQSFVFGFTPDEMAALKLDGGAGKSKEPFYKNLLKNKSAKVSSFLLFLQKYRELSKTHNVSDLITIFLTEYKIIERLLLLPQGKRMVSNIHAYLNKLRGAAYAATVSEYLYLLENELIELKIASPAVNETAVQITTIHSSKGLEFPNVIIFDVGATFNLNDTKQLMVIDKNCGLCVYTLDSDEFTKTMSIARLGAMISARRVMVAEEMRLLYVAMTRAKERLFIVGGGNIGKMGCTCEDYDILCAKSFLHLLAPALFEPVRDNCFALTVVDAEDVQVENQEVRPRVLVGVECEFSKALREIYIKEYPHKQAILKNSVSTLTAVEKEDYVKGAYRVSNNFNRTDIVTHESGAEYGTQFHKEMQHADVGEIENLIPEIKGYKIHREIVFLQEIQRDSAEIIVQGVIDLLAIKDGHAIIVDYKTTKATPEKLVKLYRPQLDMYAVAVRQAFDPQRISVYIYSTFNQTLVKV